MGKIGYGYGSEWHLTRYLGRHRHELNHEIGLATGGQVLDWLDFPFGDWAHFHLGEHKGLEFPLNGSSDGLAQKWKAFWPQTGNAMNWDAVGWLKNGSVVELLLVEAKCHTGELESRCGAKAAGGLSVITRSLDDAKTTFGAPVDADWTAPYYQYCNRLSVQHFLIANHIPARLLFIYFTGEDRMEGRSCPTCEAEWNAALQQMYRHIGVPWAVQQQRGVHKVFLPISH